MIYFGTSVNENLFEYSMNRIYYKKILLWYLKDGIIIRVNFHVNKSAYIFFHLLIKTKRFGIAFDSCRIIEHHTFLLNIFIVIVRENNPQTMENSLNILSYCVKYWWQQMSPYKKKVLSKVVRK